MLFTMFVLGALAGLVIGAACAQKYLRSARRGLSADVHQDLRAEFRRLDERMDYLEESLAAVLKNRGELVSQFAELNSRYHRLDAMIPRDRRAS
jgi:chromosome segregation ATPase